jgi:hypothetical protein
MLDMLRCAPGSRLASLAVVLLVAWPAAASAVTGLCPDGSVFVVRRAADVPCSGAKRVESSRVPPMRPENLPRAYLWDVHRQKVDPNNPYNLVDRAEQVRSSGLGEGLAPEAGVPGAAVAPEPASQVAAAPPTAAPVQGPRPSDLALTDGELRDLFYLVELSQKRAPATFLRAGPGGDDSLRVSLAHSQAFEDRLRSAGGAEGPVLLFSVQSKAAQRFLPNFTFVQQHLTYSPRRDDPSQLGLLSGGTGDLAADDLVLGYLVLPAAIDLGRPLDVYWDDHQIGATLRP